MIPMCDPVSLFLLAAAAAGAVSIASETPADPDDSASSCEVCDWDQRCSYHNGGC